MSSAFVHGDEILWFSNRRFSALVKFAIETGQETARDAEERAMAEKFAAQQMRGEIWPGIVIEITDHFPDLKERRFWTRVFFDAARAVFDRRLGNTKVSFWQASTITDLFKTGQLFRLTAQEACSDDWSPETQDGLEEARWHETVREER